MRVTSRPATRDDLTSLVRMYRRLEDEMTALHAMWPLADGLAEPVEDTLLTLVDRDDAHLLIGEIEDQEFGFLFATLESVLPQGRGERIGSIRIVFSEPEAREVGVAEAMRDDVMVRFRRQGVTKFDAHVLPGHRLAKNFFEAGGYSARSIIMHHDDEPTARPGRDPRNF